MSTRRRDDLYAGPRSRMRLQDVARLGSSAVVTPKIDGIMVRVLIGAQGTVSHVLMRSGEPAPRDVVATFTGVRHVPGSVLVGELEAMTEWSRRVAETRGYPIVWLWDCQRLNGRDVTGLTYQARRDALYRAESSLVVDDPDPPNLDEQGRHHSPVDGTFQRWIPRAGWRRLPIVPSLPARAADLAWSEWVERDGHEGLVVCRLGGAFGGSTSKAKIRRNETIDGVIVARDSSAAIVAWNGKTFPVSCRGKANAAIAVGDVVEILAAGFTERTSEPKHPRILRRRDDLQRAAA